MTTQTGAPLVYWVVGDGSDVGKTTIASAAIAVLNQSGTRTVGFKPYAAGRLHEFLDFMLEKYPGTPSKLFGSDGWNLTTASPVTGPDCLDLVVPVQLICYPGWSSSLLVRTGSTRLNNIDYFTGPKGHALLDRPDFQQLVEKTGFPLADATVAKKLDFETVASMAPEKQELAFETLAGMGVDAIVCEGASHWMPTWSGFPAINHLFYISDGNVALFPNLDLEITPPRKSKLLPIHRLTRVLTGQNRKSVSTPLPLAETGRRKEVAQDVVWKLMSETGLV